MRLGRLKEWKKREKRETREEPGEREEPTGVVESTARESSDVAERPAKYLTF